MGITTGIEWCDSTINPVMGCEGCELWAPDQPTEEQHCYAATLVNRYKGKNGWPKSFDQPEFFPSRIEKALGWSDLTGTERPDKPWLNGYPRLIFLNDLSDTFLSSNTLPADRWLPDYLLKMKNSPHIWLFLTKRPAHMVDFFERHFDFLPDNFWLGTTVTSQDTIHRAKTLIKIRSWAPTATLWISAEPLLDDIIQMIAPQMCKDIDWLVIGGESGNNARPCHPDWLRSAKDWALCWGIPYFFKQWGNWKEIQFDKRDREDVLVSPTRGVIDRLPDPLLGDTEEFKRTVAMRHMGKKEAGRLLDGREWNQMPDWKV